MEGFQLKTYHKMELAQLYFPNVHKFSATKNLNKWIEENPKLLLALEQLQYRRQNKLLTPKQVAQIVQFLGAP